MRHHYPRFGVASPDQLVLFDVLSAVRWSGDVTGSCPGRSICSGRQGVAFTCAALFERCAVVLNGRVPLDVAYELAVDALRVGLAGTPDTVANTLSCARAFFAYARHHGVGTLDEIDSAMVEAFIVRAAHRAGVYRDPAPATVRNRRWEIGELFETLRRLQLWDGPVLFGDPVPSRTGEAARPLTDRELHRVRVHAYHWLVPCRRPLVVALAEAGGTAAEIAAVEPGDIDMVHAAVTFRGEATRTNPIPTPAFDALVSALAEGAQVGERRLTVGDHLDGNNAKRSITQELSATLRDAGLGSTRHVSGRSIRLHHALGVFDRDGIGAAVRFLGARSVDTTMRSLGLTVNDL